MSSETPPSVSPSSAMPDLGATRTSAGALTFQVPGALFADRYRIVELVGVGGMGMVYHAFDERLELPVALKLLRPERAGDQEMRDRFRRELILARQVSHRNVVRIHDLGELDDVYYLTMDFVDGRSLKEMLDDDGPLPPERVIELAGQLAGALAAAHREGVVHRDLKPGNIMVDHEGRAYVTDFGIASSASAVGLTATGGIVGTPDYLAPEQARGEAVDHRADLYAFGLILYELSSRRLPFAGGSLTEVLAQRISGRPTPLRDVAAEVPDGFAAIVGRCLERDPDDRYQSADEIADDLAAGHLQARRRGIASRLARWRGHLARHAGRWLGVAALVALVAGAMWFALADRPAATGPHHAVAVLPLADDTGRAELAWLATGLAEMVTVELAESAELRVIDGPRVLRTLDDLGLVAGALSDAEQRLLAELLGVDRLMLGRVRAMGEAIRVDVRLMTTDDAELPVETFSVEVADADQISELVQRLGDALRQRLSTASRVGVGLPASGGRAAGVAFAAGLDASRRGDPIAAAEAFEQAVAAAPDFAVAWARLADTYGRLGRAEQSAEAVEKASALVAPDGRLGLLLAARRALVEGASDAAVERLAQLVDRYPNDTASRLELADVYGAVGRYDDASSVLAAITDDDPQHPRAWYLLGKFAILGGESRRAVDEYLTRALVIHNRLDDLPGQGDVLNAFGIAYQKLGAFEDAETRYHEAAEIRRRTGDLRGQSSSLFNLAMLRARRGDHTAAENDLLQVLAVRREIGDPAGIASAHNHLGHLDEQRGRYREAREHFVAGLEGRRATADQRAIAESLNNVGFVDFLLGRYAEAEAHWHEARTIYEASGNPEGETLVAQSIARLDLARGHWQPALAALLQSLESSREARRRDAEAVALGLLARAAHHQGRYSAAATSFREALDLFAELGETPAQLELTLAEAELALDLGRFDVAAEGLTRAAEWLGEPGHHERRSELRRLEGRHHLAEGRPAAAADAFTEALAAATASGSLEAELWARLGLGESALQTGDLATAAASLATVVSESRRLDHLRLRWHAALAMAALDRRRGALGAAEQRLREALDLAAGRPPVGGVHRLHFHLAEILAERGRHPEAATQLGHAAEQIASARQSLDASQRTAFDRLPEVLSIDQRTTERSAPRRDADERTAGDRSAAPSDRSGLQAAGRR